MNKSEDTKQKILCAAETEFAQNGFHGARVDKIAKLAGINKRMLYVYFGNKEELYKTVLLGVYGSLQHRESILMEQDKNVSCEKAIENVIDLYFDFLRDNPNFIRMLMWENLNDARCLKETGARDIKKSVIEYIETKINEGKSNGTFGKSASANRVTTALLTFAFSYFSNRHTLSMVLQRDLADDRELAEHKEFVHKLIAGYLKDDGGV